MYSFERKNKNLQCYDWLKNLFDQPIKNDLKTYNNIQRIVTGQRNDYTTGCLQDFPYFKE